ncbi:HARB1 nuclease, partial [Acromyrmex charruanus]
LRSVCDRFNIGRATAVRAVQRVTHALFLNTSTCIKWLGDYAERVMQRFVESSGFPKTIGAIDGTHIRIDAPKENSVDYINRKGFHSIYLLKIFGYVHLQLVCDHRTLITHMSRCTFEELLHVTAPLINDYEFANVNVEKKIMFTIWVLAKSESFLAVGDRFNLAKFKNVISAWVQLMPQYVQWPNAIQQQVSCNIFQNRSRGFPGMIQSNKKCTEMPLIPNEYTNEYNEQEAVQKRNFIVDFKQFYLKVYILRMLHI